MRPGRRRAILGALTAALASTVAGSASATVASALTIGLPAIEAKVPSVEVSLGPVHARTPETTVSVPSVGVSNPVPGGGGSGGGGESSGGGGGVVVEVPVNVPVPSGKERGAGATSAESAATTTGASNGATPSTAASGSSTSSATASTPASTGGHDHTPRAATRGGGRGSATRHARAQIVPVPTTPATSTLSTERAGSAEAQPTRNASATTHSSGNPLEAIGGHLPLPLPVPDWSKPIILLLLLLALGLAVRARMSSRRAKRLEVESVSLLDDLHAMQAALVPEVPAELAALGVSVAYRPADGVAAGGDFYDVFELEPGRVAMVLGDVCGHGREALERAALMRYTVRAYLQAGLEPRAALALAGQALADPDAHFATVAAGVYDSAEGTLTYACAGHPAPIVLGPGACVPLEACCSPPVGWGIPTGRRQSCIPLPAGTAMCFFTDGLTEARCEDGLLGSERLAALLASLGSHPSAGALVKLVTETAGATPDDLAACMLVPGAGVGAAGMKRHIEELEFDRRDLDNGGLSRFLAACDLTGPRAAELVGRAERALACGETALLKVEFARGGIHARIDVPEHMPRPDSPGSGERRSMSPLPPMPVHA